MLEELDDPLVKVLLAAALVDALINLTSEHSSGDDGGLLTVRTRKSRLRETALSKTDVMILRLFLPP